MSLRSASLGVAAVVLACAGVARAESFSLGQPILADDAAAAPRKPLMALFDKFGAGSALDSAGINIYGYAEGSWTYNFARPKDQLNAGRAYDFEDQDLTLNQLDLTIERTVDASKGKFDIGGRIEWVFGADSRFLHSSGLNFYGPGDADLGGQPFPNNQIDLNQAYLTLAIPVGTGLTVTAGKFITLLGYEYVNPTQNALYSHSYLFTFAVPTSQTGVMGKYNVAKDISLTLGFSRGWEQTSKDNNGSIDGFGSLAWNLSDKANVTVSVSSGPQQPNDSSHYRTVVDVIGTYKLGDNTTLGLNADYGYGSREGNDVGFDGQPGTGDWWGAAMYASQKLCSHATLNLRAEYFNDDDGARGLDTTATEVTAGLGITPFPNNAFLSNLLFRPELRWDHASKDIFNDGNDQNQFTAAADLIFTF